MSRDALFDLDSEEDVLKLERAIARGETIRSQGACVNSRYHPILKHPLPASADRHIHEAALRKVACMRPERQAAAAVAIGNAWVLEEVYMRGAPVDIADSSGFTPLHLAARANDVESVNILLHIGVDINAATIAGYLPRYVAQAAGSSDVEVILAEKGARLKLETRSVTITTVLDTKPTIAQPLLER